MENNDYNQAEDDLYLHGFDLKEEGGGKQLIYAQKKINDRESYVFTLGEGPKIEMPSETQDNKAKESVLKQVLTTIRNLNKNAVKLNENVTNQTHIKLRCFKLTRNDNQKYRIEEYVTPEGISEVARFFGAGKNEPDKMQ